MLTTLEAQPCAVAEQMRWDERLLDEAAGPGSRPMIRRYAWPGGDDRWATIGYFQKPELVPPDLREKWARRSTGGGLVLHHGALTWSLVLPRVGAGLAPAPRARDT